MKADLTAFAAGRHKPPTARQAEALRLVAAYLAEHGCSPTLREIGRAMGVGSIEEHVDRLERKGLLERTGARRGLVVTAAGRAFLAALPAPCGGS